MQTHPSTARKGLGAEKGFWVPQARFSCLLSFTPPVLKQALNGNRDQVKQ